ncbi:MAG: lipopolysaccharide kinase InaA family protein [Candidatus Aminicenantia bacterium]
MHHFKSITLGQYVGCIHNQYNYPVFLEQIADCNSLLNQPECRILLDSRNKIGSIKLKVENDKYKEIVIKKFSSCGLNKIKSLFFPSKTAKSWRAANRLLELEIPTSFPVAFLEKRDLGFLKEGFFITEELNDVQEIRHLFRSSNFSHRMKQLISSLANYIIVCHKRGVLHLDLSDGNLLVSEEDGNFKFYLIDVNRIKFKRNIRLLSRIKNLIRLGIPPAYQKFFLKKYLGQEKLPKFYWWWYKINKNIYWQNIQIKKKLKLRKIARLLKIQ